MKIDVHKFQKTFNRTISRIQCDDNKLRLLNTFECVKKTARHELLLSGFTLLKQSCLISLGFLNIIIKISNIFGEPINTHEEKSHDYAAKVMASNDIVLTESSTVNASDLIAINEFIKSIIKLCGIKRYEYFKNSPSTGYVTVGYVYGFKNINYFPIIDEMISFLTEDRTDVTPSKPEVNVLSQIISSYKNIDMTILSRQGKAPPEKRLKNYSILKLARLYHQALVKLADTYNSSDKNKQKKYAEAISLLSAFDLNRTHAENKCYFKQDIYPVYDILQIGYEAYKEVFVECSRFVKLAHPNNSIIAGNNKDNAEKNRIRARLPHNYDINRIRKKRIDFTFLIFVLTETGKNHFSLPLEIIFLVLQSMVTVEFTRSKKSTPSFSAFINKPKNDTSLSKQSYLLDKISITNKYCTVFNIENTQDSQVNHTLKFLIVDKKNTISQAFKEISNESVQDCSANVSALIKAKKTPYNKLTASCLAPNQLGYLIRMFNIGVRGKHFRAFNKIYNSINTGSIVCGDNYYIQAGHLIKIYRLPVMDAFLFVAEKDTAGIEALRNQIREREDIIVTNKGKDSISTKIYCYSAIVQAQLPKNKV